MKKITPEKVLHVLKTGENEIHAKPETEGAAKNALARMLELAGKYKQHVLKRNSKHFRWRHRNEVKYEKSVL